MNKEMCLEIVQLILDYGVMWNRHILLLHGCTLTNVFGKPACGTAGYMQIKQGSRSNYVLIAQDDLNTLGYKTGGLDGIFGTQTRNAVISYQRSRGLSADGIVGCNTWRSLQEDVVGTGRTATTID